MQRNRKVQYIPETILLEMKYLSSIVSVERVDANTVNNVAYQKRAA
jgi:hypothetical protein